MAQLQTGISLEKMVVSIKSWMDTSPEKGKRLFAPFRYAARLLYMILVQSRENNLLTHASALTYAILLSLVPLLATSTALVKGLGDTDQLRKVAYSYLESLEPAAPPPGNPDRQTGDPEETEQPASKLTGHLRSGIDKVFLYVERTNFAALGTVGIIGIFFSVLLVFSSVESTMNTIWKVHLARSWLRKTADYLTMLILLPLSLNLALAATTFIKKPHLFPAIDTYLSIGWLQTLVLKALPFFFITLSFYVMYIFFTNTRVKTLPALVGATAAACCWLFIQSLYINMQIGVAKYNAIYGSFATLPLFLIWIHLSWLCILGGAQIAYAVQHEKGFRTIPTQRTPAMMMAAAFDIIDTVFTAFAQGAKLTTKDLFNRLGSHPPEVLDHTLGLLLKNGFISETPQAALLPSYPQDKLSRPFLVETILGGKTPQTEGGKQSRSVVTAAAQSAAVRKQSSLDSAN